MKFSEIVDVVEEQKRLFEMALPLQKVKETLSNTNKAYNRFVHLLLIYYFRDTQETAHWKSEVATFVPKSSLVKGRNKHLSKDDVFDLIWTSNLDDPKFSYESVFQAAKAKEQQEYPTLGWDLLVEDKNGCFAFARDFHDVIASLLSLNDDVRKDYVKELINDLLEEHPL